MFRGLVVLTTSLGGVTVVAQRAHALAQDPGFRFALGARLGRVTSLVYLGLRRLLALARPADGADDSAS